jgi:hypothetical protein
MKATISYQKSATRSYRLEQNVTCLAPAVIGAVLLPVTPTTEHSKSVMDANKNNFPVKKVRISSCTTTFRFGFTQVISYCSETNLVKKIQIEKCAVEKDPKRAGATPLFGLQSAQKVFEVAPARFRSQTRHAAGQKSKCFECLSTVQEFSHSDLNEFRITACMAGPQEGETPQCQS